MFDENLSFGAYRLQAPVEARRFLQHVESLLGNVGRLTLGSDNELPRIYFDRHIYQPLLVAREGIGMAPPGLDAHKSLFVECLRAWVQAKPQGLVGQSLFLLRNLSWGRGIGFFEDAGFYPDFTVS